MNCGLLGKALSHSYSPQIHSYLGDYSYKLFEKQPEELGTFLQSGDFTGLNVTLIGLVAVKKLIHNSVAVGIGQKFRTVADKSS